MKTAALVGVCLLFALSACDAPASTPPGPAVAAPSPPVPKGPYEPLPPQMIAKDQPLEALPPTEAVAKVAGALSADEKAQALAAGAKLPKGAKVLHLVADGPLVIIHFIGEGPNDPGVKASVFQFSSPTVLEREESIDFRGWDPNRSRVGEVWAPPVSPDDETESANKLVVQKFIEGIAKPETVEAAIVATVAADFVDHTRNDGPGQAALAEGIKSAGATSTVSSIKDIAALNDIVMTVSTVVTTGPEGTPSFSPGADVYRLKAGKISERWRVNY